MKTTFVLLLCLVAFCAAQTKYTSKFDDVNVDHILQRERLLNAYINCLLHDTTCTPEGRELKRLLPDALTTNCEKCTDKQKQGAKKVIRHLSANKPDVWNQVIAKYDPQNIYRRKFADEARALGVVV